MKELTIGGVCLLNELVEEDETVAQAGVGLERMLVKCAKFDP